MRIIALIAVNRFPMWTRIYDQMTTGIADVFVRFDGGSGDPEILRHLHKIYEIKSSRLKGVVVANTPWRSPEWREECLRMLDNVGMAEGDIVLTPDEDETFGDGLVDELKAFAASEKRAMSFAYAPLESDHGAVNAAIPYPFERHVKCFKWSKGLSYYPYHGNGMPAKYLHSVWPAKTLMRHWCAYTKGLEALKHWRNDIPSLGVRAEKAVTILGFGPSADKGVDIIGTVYSCNDCYQVLPKEIMRMSSCIFEMHQLSKRDKMLTRDGRSHLGELDRLGKLGHRIICLEKNWITNSEAFGFEEIRRRGFPMYITGTPTYMLIHAIMEGATKIRVSGVDQLDYEHILQRGSWTFWCGVAMAMGIELSGHITFLDVFANRVYGRDHGPEWTDEDNRLQWLGFPFEVKLKKFSGAMEGDLRGNWDRR